MSNGRYGAGPELVLPAFGRGCLTDVLPALADQGENVLPVELVNGPRILLVLDGLGWEQLKQWSHLLPTLSAFEGDRITTVAPSTTAAALTSITTSLPPAQHGVVGYRMIVDGQVFNTLRWGSPERPDGRQTVPPRLIQPYEPFLGLPIPLVTKAEFQRTGFSEAHLRGGRLVGYRTPAVLVHEVARLAREGQPVIYAYYDGVDKVAHEYGLRSEYESELQFADRLVADVVEALPSGSQVIVTADHGQVDCGDELLPLHHEVLALTHGLSGEARFRWLHCRPEDVETLLDAAVQYHGDKAWVRTRSQMLDEGWFGEGMTADVEDRLGEVAILPFEPIGYEDPDDTGPYELIGRHGSMTGAEMYVPCVTATP